MDIEGAFWLTLIILAFVVPIAYTLYRLKGIEPIRHMLGVAVVRDQDDLAIRRAVSDACKGLDVKKLQIDEAEALLEETARHAIAAHFANANPGRAFPVTNNWPLAKCVIIGNIAVIRPILGFDYMNDHDGIRAVNFEIDRESNVLNLRPWAPKQAEPPPIGRPLEPAPLTRKPEPRPGADGTVKTSAPGNRVEPKTLQVQGAKPAYKRKT